MTLPHDIADLHLAPVALAVDARIAELAGLTLPALAARVGMASDLPDRSRAVRQRALLTTVGHLLDMHGWTLTWDGRGIRLTHGGHSLVLGVPRIFEEYVAG